MIRTNFIGMAAFLALAVGPAGARPDDQSCEQDEDEGILSIDHYVNHVSTVPATAGQHVQLFVRERVRGGVEDLGRSTEANGKAVLFVHGGTYPSVPDYDLRFKNYDWMTYLARSGFDVYSMDIQGYGWSTRPFPMGDPCNVSPTQQLLISPYPIPASAIPCAASHPFVLSSAQSDWDEVDRVVEFVRARTGQDRINLVGWSGGGPRFGGYAGLHPEKVDKVVLLAPAYFRGFPDNPPPSQPAGFPFTVSTRFHAFHERWDIQVHCANQFDPAIPRCDLGDQHEVRSGRGDLGTGRRSCTLPDLDPMECASGRESAGTRAPALRRARSRGESAVRARPLCRPRIRLQGVHQHRMRVPFTCRTRRIIWCCSNHPRTGCCTEPSSGSA